APASARNCLNDASLDALSSNIGGQAGRLATCIPASAKLLEVLGFMEPGYRPRVAVGTGGAAVFTGVSWEFFFQLLSGSSRRSFSAEWPVQWALTRNWPKLQRPQPFRLFLRACHRLPAPPTAPSDCPAQFRAHPRECSMTSALASRTLVG